MFFRVSRSLILAAPIVAMGLFGVSEIKAATQTDNFDVTATIIASCTITANDLAFGNYDPLSATPLDQTSTINVTCSNGADYDIQLSGGLSTDVNARTMDDNATSGFFLNYSLFYDAGRTNNWGVTNGTDTYQGTGTGSAQTITVYGRIPAGQTTPPVGDYTDTITATIEY